MFENMCKKTRYMLLNRLQSDCYTWLGGGGKLWGITPNEHAAAMIELYNSLEIKPQWLNLQELKTLVTRLTGSDETTKGINHV
jgi:hypothetical protein